MKMDRNKFWYVKQKMTVDEFIDSVNDGDSVCCQCGCPDVEYKRVEWCTVNDNEYVSEGESDPEYWCPCCEDHIGIESFEDWKEENKEQFFIKEKE